MWGAAAALNDELGRAFADVPHLTGLAALAGGLVLCLAGWRAFRPLLALLGFAAGSLAAATLGSRVFPDSPNILWLIAFIAGGVGAFLSLFLYAAARFLIGAAIGAGFAVGVVLIAWPAGTDPWAFVAAAAGAVAGALLHRAFLVALTALAGSALALVGTAALADLSRPLTILADPPYVFPLPTAFGVPGVVWLLLALAGVASQFRVERGRRTPRKSAPVSEPPEEEDEEEPHAIAEGWAPRKGEEDG